MYRKFRNVPSFKDIPPICPYFLGFRVGKYGAAVAEGLFVVSFFFLKYFWISMFDIFVIVFLWWRKQKLKIKCTVFGCL